MAKSEEKKLSSKEYGKRESKFLKASQAQKEKILRESDQRAKIYYLDLLKRTDADKLAEKIGFKDIYEANAGGGVGALPATFFKGEKGGGGTLKVPEKLPAATQAYKDLLLGEAQKGLPGMLEQLRTPYTSPINQSIESIFGHLQNPILQNLMNPDARFAAGRSLFPSEIEQEYNQQYGPQSQSALGNLLGALGNSFMQSTITPYLNRPETFPEWVQAAEEYGPQAYNYAMGSRPIQALQALGRVPGNLNQGLENYIQGGLTMREPKTWGQSFQQAFSPQLYAARHPLEALSELGQFGKNAYNKLRGQ